MRAVLAHAIRAAQNEARGSRALSARREAIAWIMSEDRADVFAFENICETLGIDASRVRAMLARTPLGGMPLPNVDP